MRQPLELPREKELPLASKVLKVLFALGGEMFIVGLSGAMISMGRGALKTNLWEDTIFSLPHVMILVGLAIFFTGNGLMIEALRKK